MINTDILRHFLPIHRATYNIYAPHLLCPTSASRLKAFPRNMVEFTNLRTHIRHVEAVAHGSRAPFHIACRTHVASVVSRALIVIEGNTIRPRQGIIGNKLKAATVKPAIGLCRGKFPRYPIRVVRLVIEVRHITRLKKQLTIFPAFHSILESNQRFHASPLLSPYGKGCL